MQEVSDETAQRHIILSQFFVVCKRLMLDDLKFRHSTEVTSPVGYQSHQVFGKYPLATGFLGIPRIMSCPRHFGFLEQILSEPQRHRPKESFVQFLMRYESDSGRRVAVTPPAGKKHTRSLSQHTTPRRHLRLKFRPQRNVM